MKKIVICTLRDNKGATGGPGGVVYMINQTLGAKQGEHAIQYRFNPIQFGGRFRLTLNKILFYLRCLFDRNVYYICHDIDAGAVLSSQNKDYSLVYHNQGPIVQELLNLGRSLSESDKKKLKNTERRAFTNAKSLHFPSKGASDMYFDNIYATCRRDEVTVGDPLYNTIPIEQGTPVEGLKREKDKMTFFSLGTLTDAKGQDQTIEFLSKYVDANEGKKIRYIVVGKGPLEQLLKDKANEISKKNPNFEFVYYPALKHSEVMYVHEISDIYIMLHRISIFDFATLEAMSSRSAVVLSPVGGNLDFNKLDNVLYVNDNEEHIVIPKLNDDNCQKLKDLNYEAYCKYFSGESFKNNYISLISSK